MPAPQRPRNRPSHGPHTKPPVARVAVAPLSEQELDELQGLLDRVPQPFEPLDVSMLDGFLCGVLLQPQRIPESRWLPCVTDSDARPLPASFDASRLHSLTRRRHAELDDAIGRRQWFDPWVFELRSEDESDNAVESDSSDDADQAPSEVDAVYPWVAGFATAQEFFPALMQFDASEITEPLALIYRHFDADDLEDADDLLAEVDTLEPPVDLAEAVEGLVRAVLLLADVSRPVGTTHPARAAPRSRPPNRR